MDIFVRNAEAFGLKLRDFYISLEPQTVVAIVIVISLVWLAKHLLTA